MVQPINLSTENTNPADGDWFVIQVAAGGAGSVQKIKRSNLIKGRSCFSCRVATTGSITLSGSQTIDGVTLSNGDVVLVKNQNGVGTHINNGTYIYNSSGAWTRTYLLTGQGFGPQLFTVGEEGTINYSTVWIQGANPGIVDTNAIGFSLVAANNNFFIDIDGSISGCNGDFLVHFVSGIGAIDLAGQLSTASGAFLVDVNGNILKVANTSPIADGTHSLGGISNITTKSGIITGLS